MDIEFKPQRREDTVEYIKKGDSLFVNGKEFNFSPLLKNQTLPSSAIDCEYIVGTVSRDSEGNLTLQLILPNPLNFSQEQAFPEKLYNVKDGIVEQPSRVPSEETN